MAPQLNSQAISIFFGKLVFDDSGTVIANRIADAAPMTMNGGAIQLNGNSSTPVEEALGQLNIFGVSSITISQPGSTAAQLTFAGIQRNGHATLDILGSGVKFTGLSNGSTGIVPAYITTGNEWATVGGDGRMTAWTAYAGDINTGSTSDHVKLTASGTTSLAATTTRASLNMQNGNSAASEILDLAGHNLSLTTGGILSSGAGTTMIQGGEPVDDAVGDDRHREQQHDDRLDNCQRRQRHHVDQVRTRRLDARCCEYIHRPNRDYAGNSRRRVGRQFGIGIHD